MAAGRTVRIAGRALRVFALTLAGVVGLVALAYAALTSTPTGRAAIRDIALREVNALLAGQLRVAEIARVGLWGVSLRDAEARDPSGAVVLRVKSIAIDLAPLRLLAGEIAATRVAISGADVKLADLGEQRGVVAAFMPREPSTEPEQPGGEPPRIAIDAIELDGIAVTMELAEVGLVGVQRLRARGRYALRGESEAELAALHAALTRNGAVVGTLDRAQGRLARAGEASAIKAHATLARTAIALDASSRLPGDPEFGKGPVALALRVDALDAEMLRAVGQEALASSLRTAVRADVKLDGTADDLHGTVALDSSAGRVESRLVLRGRDDLEVALALRELQPSALLGGAPAQRIDAELEARARIAAAPAKLPFDVRLTRGAVDGHALPVVHARGAVDGEQVRDVVVEARGYGGTLDVTGEAGFDGTARAKLALRLPSLVALPSWMKERTQLECTTVRPGSLSLDARVAYTQARLDADAELKALEFAAAGFAAQSIDMKIAAHGRPEAPVLDVELHGHTVTQGKLAISTLTLDAHGGPKQYRLGYVMKVDQGELTLQSEIALRKEAVDFSVVGSGSLRDRPFSLRVPKARIGFDGSIGQLVLDARGIDLGALSQALTLEPLLVGKVGLTLSARGTLQVPELNVRVRGVGLGTAAHTPRAEAVIDAELSAVKGTGTVTATVASEDDLELTTKLSARFKGGRPDWPSHVRAAELEGTLEIDPLSSTLVEAYLPDPLPARGTVKAKLDLKGTIDAPELSARVRTRIWRQSRDRQLEIAANALYARSRAELTLEASDLRGSDLRAKAALERPADSLAGFMAGPESLLHHARWQLELDLDAKSLDLLPLDIELPDELAAISAKVSLAATHAPEQEPEARLAVHVDRGRSALAESSCDAPPLAMALNAELRGERLTASLTGQSQVQRLFGGEIGAGVTLAPALAAQGTPALRDTKLGLELAQLDLAGVPFVCGTARGKVSGKLSGEGLLGEAPVVEVELRGEQLSLGTRKGLDLELTAEAHQLEATLKASLHQGSGPRSTIEARMPIRLRGAAVGTYEELPLEARVRLRQLPIAPLFPRSFAVSHASGEVSGSIDVEGTLGEPSLRGHLEPKDVALTITQLAQPIHGVGGKLTFTEEQIVIEELTARDHGGKLTVRGSAKLGRDKEPHRAELTVEADKFPLRQQGQIVGELEARIDAKAELKERETYVFVKLRDVSAWLAGGETRKGISLDEHPDIVDPRNPREAEAAAAEQEGPPSLLELRLDADDSFWVRREDFAVKLSTKLVIRSEDEKLSITGPLQIHRGYLQLLGETFEIDRSSKVEFIGGDTPDPVLEIKAGTLNRKTNKRLDVEITGRASAPVLKFSSDGTEMTAGEAAQMIFGGGGDQDSQGGLDATKEAQSFVTGMMAGVLAMSARREFGEAVPILMIEPQDDLRNTRVRAGFELDNLVPSFLDDVIRGVYVEGIFAGGSETENDRVQGGVLIELYLPHDFVTSGSYGPGETWSLDLGWEP